VGTQQSHLRPEGRAMTGIERASRALCAVDGLDPDEDWTTDDQTQIQIAIPKGERQRWRLYARKARVAIEAIREPTEAMVDAGGQIEVPAGDYNYSIGGIAREVWSTMIDSALNEKP
jgi:hypothetical protein